MSSRKKIDITALAGTAPAAAKNDGVDTAVTTVRMHLVVGNPDNPRSKAEYTDKDADFVELKQTMSQVGQLQPIAVVSRDVWLRHLPEHTKEVGTAQYVALGGNRRLAAARALRWTLIDVRVQDHLGKGEEHQLDESVLIDNIHRKAIAPCKEARFLKRMVAKHGSQDAVAKRIGKTQMYVSQRLALLKLAPDLQDLVDAKVFKLKAARELAGRTADHDEQRAAYEELVAEPKAAKPEKSQGVEATAAASAGAQNAVLAPPSATVPEQASPPDDDEVQNPVLNSAASPLSQAQVTPSDSGPTSTPHGSAEDLQNPVLKPPAAVAVANPPNLGGLPVDWADADEVLAFLMEHMPLASRKRLASRLLRENTEL
ncbi:ParB/RepB/Spo0J family partition protein [Streptomyces sp. NPDC087440]|uniref:ParB/RepB/Spo0J family partition protein n=1 Tax=Streptomyces sp. NPDC087440 TaxID=3365790 RepID=UPI00380BB3D9